MFSWCNPRGLYMCVAGRCRVPTCAHACVDHRPCLTPARALVALPDMLAVYTTVGVAERMLQSEYYSFTHKTATKMSVMRLGGCLYYRCTIVC